jgi:uncharacterized protein (TIGR02453 family)
MSKKYFSEEYLSFFRELASNNNKDWFDSNRERYQTHVKKTFENFIADLIEVTKKDANLGDLKPSECIFRINKDVRFSKDKTPYKLEMSALINKGGKKNMHDPGLYISLGPEFMHIYTGFYMLEKDHLMQVRQKIANNPEMFEKILQASGFKKSFGEVRGEKSKILPPGIKEKANAHPLVFNKQFYIFNRSEAEKILDKDLLKFIQGHYKNAKVYNDFLGV